MFRLHFYLNAINYFVLCVFLIKIEPYALFNSIYVFKQYTRLTGYDHYKVRLVNEMTNRYHHEQLEN